MEKIQTSALDEALVDVGYHVIDNFLSDSNYQALQMQIQTLSKTDAFRPAKIGRSTGTTHHPQVRTDHICWLNESHHNPALLAFYTAIECLKQTLNRTLFLGLEQFEAHFAVYHPGQFYKKHIDQFMSNQDRRISCVYYLNDAWQPEDGGGLSLYDTDEHSLATLSPLGNRLVCFNSTLPHEVLPAQRLRYSITGWLKSRSLS